MHATGLAPICSEHAAKACAARRAAPHPGHTTCLFTAAADAQTEQGTSQQYPSRLITIIVPFGAGSGTDVVTRIIAEPLGVALKQTIVTLGLHNILNAHEAERHDAVISTSTATK